MTALARSPHLIDLVLLVTMFEAIWLIMFRRQRDGAREPQALVPGPRIRLAKSPATEVILLLLPGICLMLAIRAAMIGDAWPWVPMALLASFAAHVADLWYRWGRR